MDMKNGTRVTVRRQSKRKRSTGSGKPYIHEPSAVAPLPSITQRVFLYIQLDGLQKMPLTQFPLELHLYHAKNTLQKMQERYTSDTIIYQHEFGLKKPTFALGILQDNIEDMNMFSDNPLIITLYQRIPRHRKGELNSEREHSQTDSWKMMAQAITTDSKSDFHAGGDHTTQRSQIPMPLSSTTISTQEITPKSKKKVVKNKSKTTSDTTSKEDFDGEDEDEPYVEEHLEFISRGHCDLLQLFQRKRFISNIEIFLYPQYDNICQPINSKNITTTSQWQMYSILPILKQFTFTNLAFVTLESIYNAPSDLNERAASLGVNLLFRATQPDAMGEHALVPFCSYYGFNARIISAQNTSIVWENMKRDLNMSSNCGFNQMETNGRIKLPRLFHHLLCPDGVDLQLNEIDPLVDVALINNSLHRFVLTNSMRAIVEKSVVHNDFELLVQLYQDTTTNVLYEGVINMSVFGYPNTNFCRFATNLMPISKSTAKPKTNTNTNTRLSDDANPMFAIIKICFFQPLTLRNDSLDIFNENLMNRYRLRRCLDIKSFDETDDCDLVNELYRSFDEYILDLIAFIVKRNIHSVIERREFFCCQLGNMSNLLLKICGCDFNVRIPTKTNIEFRQMLTHMYNELIGRVNSLLMSCGGHSLGNCVVNYEADQIRIISIMENFSMLNIIGQTEVADIAFQQLKATTANKKILNFYIFLHDVANMHFDEAAKYFLKPKDRDWGGEYFASLVKLYLNYMQQLQNEQTAGEAYVNLLDELRIFTSTNPTDVDGWILLYCFYKDHNYMPGMEFTRWKFENLFDVPRKNLAYAPRSLYELYLPTDCEVRTHRGRKIYQTFKLFVRLGIFDFAEVVFREIASDCSAIDAYLIRTTLKLLQRRIDGQFKLSNMPTEKSERGKLMQYFLAHINGNVEHARGNIAAAIKQFSVLLDITEPDWLDMFQLSFLILAQLNFERGDFEQARRAYQLCLTQKSFLPHYGMGLSLYYLNQLEQAIECFARCTEVDLFVPDVWAYMAIANLRLHKNKRALDCWKVSKMYPEINISSNVYAELEKIKYSDVSLLVDDGDNDYENGDFI